MPLRPLEAMTDPEFDDEEDEVRILRAKGSFDGAKSLAEAATMLRAYAEYFDGLHGAGWLLQEPIRDDYAFYYHPDPLINALQV